MSLQSKMRCSRVNENPGAMYQLWLWLNCASVLQWWLYRNESFAIASSTVHIPSPTTPSGQPQDKIQQLLNNPRTGSREGRELRACRYSQYSQRAECGSRCNCSSITENGLLVQIGGPSESRTGWVWGYQSAICVLTSPPEESETDQLLRKAEKNYPRVNPGCISARHSVVSDSLQPRGGVAHQTPLSMGFSRQEYWEGCHSLLQGIFPTKGLNPGLPHCGQILYPLSHQGSRRHPACIYLGSLCFNSLRWRAEHPQL